MARALALIVVFATAYSLVLPAITMTSPLTGEMDGVDVRIEADDGALRPGTSLVLKQVLLPGEVAEDDSEPLRQLTEDEMALILEAALDGDESLKAEILKVMDISLEWNGAETEPLKAVRLIMKSDLIKDANQPVLVHLSDDGIAELVELDGEQDGSELPWLLKAAEADEAEEPEISTQPGETVLPGEDEEIDPEDAEQVGEDVDPEDAEQTGEEVDPEDAEQTGEEVDPEDAGQDGKVDTDTPATSEQPGKTETPATTTRPRPSTTGTPATSDNTGKTETPATSDNTGKTETPATSDNTGKTETPATSDNTGKTETPATSDNTGKTETPATSDNTGKTETPATSDNTGKTETPAASDNTGKTETPTTTTRPRPSTTGTPAASDNTGKTEAPAASGSSSKTETPAASDNSSKTEAPAASGSSSKTETPAASGSSSKTETPASSGSSSQGGSSTTSGSSSSGSSTTSGSSSSGSSTTSGSSSSGSSTTSGSSSSGSSTTSGGSGSGSSTTSGGSGSGISASVSEFSVYAIIDLQPISDEEVEAMDPEQDVEPVEWFKDIVGDVEVTVTGTENAFPEGTTMELTLVPEEEVIDAVVEAVEETFGTGAQSIETTESLEIAEGIEAPEATDSVEAIDSIATINAMEALGPMFPIGDGAAIGAVEDLAPETVNEVTIIRSVDITFYNADGEKIEPSEPINVVMKLVGDETIDTEQTVLVHIGEDNSNVVRGTEIEADQVSFTSDEFSIYSIATLAGDYPIALIGDLICGCPVPTYVGAIPEGAEEVLIRGKSGNNQFQINEAYVDKAGCLYIVLDTVFNGNFDTAIKYLHQVKIGRVEVGYVDIQDWTKTGSGARLIFKLDKKDADLIFDDFFNERPVVVSGMSSNSGSNEVDHKDNAGGWNLGKDGGFSIDYTYSVEIEKALTDADGNPIDPPKTLTVGDTLYYTITIRNTGTGAYPAIDIKDTLSISGYTGVRVVEKFISFDLLPAGETVQYTYAYTIEDDDVGMEISNVAALPDGTPTAQLEVKKRTNVAEGEKVEVGKKITYTLIVKNTGNVDLPNSSTTATVHDTMNGISFTNTDNVTYNPETKLFTIKSIKAGEEIEITYTYVVNLEDVEDGKLKNIATTSTGDEDSTETEVEIPKTATLRIKKVASAAEGEEQITLAGAEFTLVSTTIGEDETPSWSEDGTSGLDGIIEFTDIPVDTNYTLTETVAPNGYLSAGSVTVNVDESGVVSIVGLEEEDMHWSGPEDVKITDNDGNITGIIYVVTVTDYPGTALPETGGMGVTLYTLVGLSLMGAAYLGLKQLKRGRA